MEFLSVFWGRAFQKQIRLLPSVLVVLGLLLSTATVQRVLAQTSTVYLPLISSKSKTCASNVASTPFGLQMYSNTSKSSSYHSELIASSASWVRVYVNWAEAEPINTTPDKFDWSKADLALGAALNGCLNMLAVITAPPSFAYLHPPTYSEVINPNNLDDFAEFVQALVERYDGDGVSDAPGSPVVKDWEFFNEPDGLSAPNADNWGDHGTEYAAMLATVYPVVKAANPQAKVVFGGMAYDWWKETTPDGPFSRAFLDDVLKAGGGANFDVMNFHYYPLFGHNWTTSNRTGFVEKAAAIRTKLQGYSLTKPVIATEIGWHNNPSQNPPSTDETQIRYITILFVQTMAANIDYSIWWTLYDAGEPYLDTGLVTNADPPVRKPGFWAFFHLSQELRTATFERALTSAEMNNSNMEGYRFLDAAKQRSVTTAWLNPVSSTETAKLSLSATSATVKDVFGVTKIVTDAADGSSDGKVTIDISGTPVYIEVAQ